jgi:hypothetical protein
MVQSKAKLVDELADRGSNGEEAACVFSDETGNSQTFDAISNGNDASGEHGNFFEAQQDEITSP